MVSLLRSASIVGTAFMLVACNVDTLAGQNDPRTDAGDQQEAQSPAPTDTTTDDANPPTRTADSGLPGTDASTTSDASPAMPDTSTQTADSSTGSVPHDPQCAQGTEGVVVVACNLSPSTMVVGADQDFIYLMDHVWPGLSLHRWSKTNFETTQVYSAEDAWTGEAFTSRISDRYPMHRGRFYLDVSKGNLIQLVEVDPRTGKNRVVIDKGLGFNWALDGDYIYWSHEQGKDGCSRCGEATDLGIKRTSLVDGTTELIANRSHFLYGVGGGHLFFSDQLDPSKATERLFKVAIGGGPTTALVDLGAMHRYQDSSTEVAPGPDGTVYYVGSDWSVRSVSPDGTQGQFLPDGFADALLAHDGYLYAYGSFAKGIQRTKLVPGSAIEDIFPASMASDLTAPVFDGDLVYTTYPSSAPAKPLVGVVAAARLP